MDRYPSTAAIVVLALLLPAVVLMAGCTQQEPLTVRIADHPTYGKLLTDSTGRSLYIQARDVPNTGAVANLGEVGRFYPPFYAESVASGNGINISEFGHITRADGKQQTTFRGWPLYYYINDKVPGDAKSQGANNITFLAKPDYTVMVRENTTSGIYLSDTAGAALLVRNGDTTADPGPGYAPFRASPVVAPAPLVQAGDFAETVTPSGQPQTAYRGQPLYSFTGQGRPGAIPGDTDGYRPVILAPGGAFASVVETPAVTTAKPTDTAGAATAKPGVTAAATTTRGGYDSYTGGVYTPTPFRTVQVVSHATDSGTPSSTWTPLGTGAPTAAPATPLPTVTGVPVTVAPTDLVTSLPTAVPTATPLPTVTGVPMTAPPTAPPTPVPTPTALPPTPVPTPIPQPPTTVPVPISTSPTTLPLPFPLPTPNPAAAVPGGSAS